MSVPVTAAPRGLTFPLRLLLFGLAAALGVLTAFGWSLDLSDAAYNAVLQNFLNPEFQIANLGVALVLGFLLGFGHIFRICYLPAALAVMPLVQAAKNKRDWLKTVAVLTVSMVLVSALWGALVSVPAAALAGTVGSRRAMALLMQPILIVTGLLMLMVALGELGLIRRLLPDIQLPEAAAQGAANLAGSSPYRRTLILGVVMAATFGIICNRPLYVALLVYVALGGSIVYGALALGVYGVGLAISVALAGLVLLPAGRSARLIGWLAGRQDAFHIVQGLAFAVMGALSVSYFWLRYGPLIPAV